MDLIALLVALVVFLIVAYIIWLVGNFIITKFGIPDPIGTIVMLVIGLVLLLLFLRSVGLWSGTLRFGRAALAVLGA